MLPWEWDDVPPFFSDTGRRPLTRPCPWTELKRPEGLRNQGLVPTAYATATGGAFVLFKLAKLPEASIKAEACWWSRVGSPNSRAQEPRRCSEQTRERLAVAPSRKNAGGARPASRDSRAQAGGTRTLGGEEMQRERGSHL